MVSEDLSWNPRTHITKLGTVLCECLPKQEIQTGRSLEHIGWLMWAPRERLSQEGGWLPREDTGNSHACIYVPPNMNIHISELFFLLFFTSENQGCSCFPCLRQSWDLPVTGTRRGPTELLLVFFWIQPQRETLESALTIVNEWAVLDVGVGG